MRSDSILQGLPELRDYEVLEKLAEGSMASVYKGQRRADGCLVAIKVPHPEVADDEVLRERFRTEFRVGKKLDHANIVRTLDFGQEAGTYFLVLEFVDGPDLWERIQKEGRLPEAEAVEIIVQVAHGLHEVHKHGVIHRDVKPDNILLTAKGRAKLADLGLIKDLEGENNLTCAHKGLGMSNYIAPEQFTEARHADVRYDVYSLGASLYAAVTGVVPFPARSLAATLRKKLNNDLTPAREIVPSLSESLDWTIRRALQADPGRRHGSCLELAQALTGKAGPGGPVASRGAGRGAAGKRARPEEERRRAVRYACTLATVCEIAPSFHQGATPTVDRWPGQVLNLSVTGAGLLLNRRFEPGTVATLLLENPKQTSRVLVEMCVVRAFPAENKQWFIGAVFRTPLDKTELRDLL